VCFLRSGFSRLRRGHADLVCFLRDAIGLPPLLLGFLLQREQHRIVLARLLRPSIGLSTCDLRPSRKDRACELVPSVPALPWRSCKLLFTLFHGERDGALERRRDGYPSAFASTERRPIAPVRRASTSTCRLLAARSPRPNRARGRLDIRDRPPAPRRVPRPRSSRCRVQRHFLRNIHRLAPCES